MKTKICQICLKNFEYKQKHRKFCNECKNIRRIITTREWNNRNCEHRTQYLRNYLLTANGIYAHLKYESKRRQIQLLFTKEEFSNWYLHQTYSCYYCSRSLSEILDDKRERRNAKLRLSIDRLDSNKDYSLDNIVLACYRCNHIKSEYFTADEMLKIGKIIYHV